MSLLMCQGCGHSHSHILLSILKLLVKCIMGKKETYYSSLLGATWWWLELLLLWFGIASVKCKFYFYVTLFAFGPFGLCQVE